MAVMEDYKFWFVTGSQSLYGYDVLDQVAANSREIVDKLNA